VQVFMGGGVPEVMLHLRKLGLLQTNVVTVTGERLDAVLDWWEQSERRRTARALLTEHGVDPDNVIVERSRARQLGMTGTLVFPKGNLALEGSVVKATALDRSLVENGQYRHTGPARGYRPGPVFATSGPKRSRGGRSPRFETATSGRSRLTSGHSWGPSISWEQEPA